MSALKVDENGFVVGVRYHDGYCDGLLLMKKELWIFVRPLDGAPHVIVLSGVKRMLFDSFQEGNVIGSMRLFAGPMIADDVVDVVEQKLGLVRENLEDEDFVFVMDGVCGVGGVCVCGGAEVRLLSRLVVE